MGDYILLISCLMLFIATFTSGHAAANGMVWWSILFGSLALLFLVPITYYIGLLS